MVARSEWYEQCVPNNHVPDRANQGGGNQGGGAVVTRTITTVFNFDDPIQTRITTAITYLTPVITQAPVITLQPDTPYRPPRE